MAVGSREEGDRGPRSALLANSALKPLEEGEGVVAGVDGKFPST
jgi:hypothetical protein